MSAPDALNAIAAVLERSKSEGSAREVLLWIAWHGPTSWPSLDEIARRSGLSRRTVLRCIQRLAGSGEIRVDKQRFGPSTRNVYEIALTGEVDPPPQCHECACACHREGESQCHDCACACHREGAKSSEIELFSDPQCQTGNSTVTNGKFHGDTNVPESALELKAELKAEQTPQTPLLNQSGTFGAEHQSQNQKPAANEDVDAEHLAELRSWLLEHDCQRDEAEHVLSRFRYFDPARGPLRAFAARVLDDYRLAAIEQARKAREGFKPRLLKRRDLEAVAKNPRADFNTMFQALDLGRRFGGDHIGAARDELREAQELARRGELVLQGENDPKPPGGGGGGEPVKTTPGDKPLSPAEASEVLGSDRRPKWTCSGCGRRWYYDRDACPALDCLTRGQMQQAC